VSGSISAKLGKGAESGLSGEYEMRLVENPEVDLTSCESTREYYLSETLRSGVT